MLIDSSFKTLNESTNFFITKFSFQILKEPLEMAFKSDQNCVGIDDIKFADIDRLLMVCSFEYKPELFDASKIDDLDLT